MENIKRMPAENLADLDLPFQDKRLPEMLFRYRARNFPESLNSEESLRWQAWCAEQIKTNPNGVGLTAVDYFARLEKLAIEKPEEKELLACLYSYADRLCQKMNIVP